MMRLLLLDKLHLPIFRIKPNKFLKRYESFSVDHQPFSIGIYSNDITKESQILSKYYLHSIFEKYPIEWIFKLLQFCTFKGINSDNPEKLIIIKQPINFSFSSLLKTYWNPRYIQQTYNKDILFNKKNQEYWDLLLVRSRVDFIEFLLQQANYDLHHLPPNNWQNSVRLIRNKAEKCFAIISFIFYNPDLLKYITKSTDVDDFFRKLVKCAAEYFSPEEIVENKPEFLRNYLLALIYL